MKKNFVVLAFGFLMLSCSSDDSTAPVTPVDNTVSEGDYLPLENDNSWEYEVQGTLQTGTDNLYISGDINMGANTYKQFVTEAAPIGFYSSAVNGNGIRKDGDRLMLTGTAMMSFIQDFPMNIELNEFTILDESEANGQILATVTGTTPYQYEEYTFNFNYTLSSVSMGSLSTYTAPNGEIYNDVKAVQVRLNVLVNTIFNAGGTIIPITIMPAQDVVISTRYFAKDVGVVHSATNINYQLANLSQFGISLPIPENFTAEQDEVLINYNLN